MKVSLFALCMAQMALLGCVVAEPPSPDPTDACQASELQGLVGQAATVLEGMRFGQRLRVIRFGMAVTMDYDPARLNILLDQKERIERVSCG